MLVDQNRCCKVLISCSVNLNLKMSSRSEFFSQLYSTDNSYEDDFSTSVRLRRP